ncbi:hypothetical protein [Ciceribacter ferrooxidans]|uniref:Uncharacterized protein n=1 Tax=Ciceribacter ferrooxidans TaxID=2509717 RepID=A0A4Q2SW23_9HYPH|nr:hypothetical protein [Ciceribacter ferrooxidans]RYC10042.1 hypothetical protein EUU22_18370 [Ciceribacter ferrooxidans]
MAHLCTILPFPARRLGPRAALPPVDDFAVEQLGHAEDHLAVITADIEVARESALSGIRLEGLGGVRSGRTLLWACRLVLTIVNLRGNPEEDHDLSRAARAWLQRRGQANG